MFDSGDFGTWLSVAVLCALGAASPGPSLVVVLHHGVRGSRLHGLTCALAHSVGVGLYALLTSLGLAAFLDRQPGVYRALTTAGALYLLWLGFRLVRSRGIDERAARFSRASAGLVAAARDGFATALFNPKIALFFLALFSQFVGPNPEAGAVLILTATAMCIDAAWYCIVAFSVTSTAFPGFLRAHAAEYDRFMGLVLLAAGSWILGSLAVRHLA